MPQSLARLHIHLVFSTKNRAPLLNDNVRDSLHRYMAVVLKNLDCPATLINSVDDHVHILFELGRTVALSSAVRTSKNHPPNGLKPKASNSLISPGRPVMAPSPFPRRT
jgi:REP element-mobilizing transposase RayT